MLNNLQKWLIEEMIKHLQEMESQVVYGCDLAFKMFEDANYTGSYTCSSYEASKWIKDNWFDLCEVVEEYEYEFGEYPDNCWINPERFQVQIILYMASSLVAESDYIEDNWNDEIELTEDVIKTIISEWSDCL